MPRALSNSNIPSRKVYQHNISQFLGVDLSNAPSNVKEYRSPDAKNMIPDLAGKPVKRTGYYMVAAFGGAINGYFYLDLPTGSFEIVHAGETLYNAIDGSVLYSGMNDVRSTAWQVDGKLWIMDGKALLCCQKVKNLDYDPENPMSPEEILQATPASEVAYTPMVTISRSPSGGGEQYEPVNLLSGKFTDSFLANGTDAVYQLSFSELDDTAVVVQKLDAEGNWQELTEETDFTVDRTAGTVTFTTAPESPAVAGADNVRITASRENTEGAAMINRCDISILYGVAGASDRLFVAGNPDYPNRDWYSQMNDPTYFGDLWYSVLGQDGAAIMGYSILNNRLATHKDRAENGRNVVVRTGQLVDGQAAFPITTTLQGEGAIGKHTFAYLSTEPLFLTRLGIYAITSQDISGEKYSQNRSFYINKRLTTLPNLSEAYATIYKDFYMLATGGNIYILDGGQKHYENNEPYSNYQYECYYWADIPANILWQRDDTLFFGTDDGRVMAFYTDYEDLNSFNDLGQPIEAYWEIPDFDGKQFYQNKTVRYIAFRLAAATATSVQVFGQIRGLWQSLFDVPTAARYYAFSKTVFSKFTFSTDATPKTIGRKIKIKKVDKMRLRLQNDQLNEPFGLYELSLEYTEKGYYKKR